MIELDRVTVTFDGVDAVLRDVSVRVEEGDLCVVAGPTGVGKSTLLGLVSGLVPHFTGGTVSGHVRVAGRDTRTHPPRDLADVVGVVGQDPAAGFVTDAVEDELAFVTEQLGVPPAVMRTRVEEAIDLLGLQPLRHRRLATLSGGEQQRVAIASVLTAQPQVLVLDEPTSALDPNAAEEVLAAVARLVHDLGVTALIAEHRLERIVQFADRVIEVRGDRTVVCGEPSTILATAAVAPPVVQLGRALGWDPLPLSVRDARRAARAVRTDLADRTPARPVPVAPSSADPVLTVRGLTVRHGTATALDGVDLDAHAGSVTAIMGRNGAGKSSLLWAVQGTGVRSGGSVDVAGTDPAAVTPDRARTLVTLVPQTPGDLLYTSSVAEECRAADDDGDLPAGTTRALLARLAPDVPDDRHPRDLSEGQRLTLALAVQLGVAPRVVALDEPTRGLDYAAKDRLAELLAELAADGAAVLVATHDVEFVATACDRVVLLAEGQKVADDAARAVLISSTAIVPQVARILHPIPLLTVAEALDAVRTSTSGPGGAT